MAQCQQTIFQQARIYGLKFEQLLREREHKEVLLYTIIHNLAEPLTSIHGALELMESGRTSSKLTSMALEQCQLQKRMIGTILETFVLLAPNNPLPMSRSEAQDIILSAEHAFTRKCA
ncbi:MAG: signal transduction histidine kinase [Patiriisocius sp.]